MTDDNGRLGDGTEREMDGYRPSHFVSDFEVYVPSHEPQLYRCRRCGQEIIGKQATYDHRRGTLSKCFWNRLANAWNRMIDWYERNLSKGGDSSG